jgi:hypothetical protein
MGARKRLKEINSENSCLQCKVVKVTKLLGFTLKNGLKYKPIIPVFCASFTFCDGEGLISIAVQRTKRLWTPAHGKLEERWELCSLLL